MKPQVNRVYGYRGNNKRISHLVSGNNPRVFYYPVGKGSNKLKYMTKDEWEAWVKQGAVELTNN
jgi:hypothetical protein